MPLHDSDISWQVLRRIVREWAGTAAELAEVRPLEGGCINTTLCITTETGERCVLKIAPHRVTRDFEREAAQLTILRDRGVPAPRVYGQKTATLDDPHSYLLMEFIEGVDLAEARKQCSPQQLDALQEHLAEIVARLHDHTGDSYQRVAHPENRQFKTWTEFFHHVYDPIWKECEKAPHLRARDHRQIARIHENLDRILAHQDHPRLVHWDIWATNLLARQDEHGNWRIAALLDPNCKYAHAEAEIAYLELFQTVTPAFMKAYQRRHKLDEEYHRSRKWVYQLYPMIDHVVLFGEQYLKPLHTVLERVTAAAA